MAPKFKISDQCKADQQAGKSASYSVYLHHANANNPNTMQFWEKVETTADKDDAINKARALYKSRKCPIVEVKKKYKHARRNYTVNETIKTYGDISAEPLTWYMKIALGLIFFALIGTVLYASTTL